MPTRKSNPRTEIQASQRYKFLEFARNGTRELIFSCSNRMATKQVSQSEMLKRELVLLRALAYLD
jgi:hypothetical protein